MKVTRGVNPDYADYDEIDPDVEDALEEYEAGVLTYEELKALIGPEAAQAFLDKDPDDPESYFDDPEDF